MIPAVILAAGASTRLGAPKQLAEIHGETLLERAIRTAREAACSSIIVVLGAEYITILAQNQLRDAVPVINDQWPEGMGSSIRLGVRTLGFIAKDAAGVLLMTCDQPAVTPAHLRALIATGQITASAYAGRSGVPAYFPAAAFPDLLLLHGDSGARTLLQTAPAIDLPNGELDIDTPADLLEARRRFA